MKHLSLRFLNLLVHLTGLMHFRRTFTFFAPLQIGEDRRMAWPLLWPCAVGLEFGLGLSWQKRAAESCLAHANRI